MDHSCSRPLIYVSEKSWNPAAEILHQDKWAVCCLEMEADYGYIRKHSGEIMWSKRKPN